MMASRLPQLHLALTLLLAAVLCAPWRATALRPALTAAHVSDTAALDEQLANIQRSLLDAKQQADSARNRGDNSWLSVATAQARCSTPSNTIYKPCMPQLPRAMIWLHVMPAYPPSTTVARPSLCQRAVCHSDPNRAPTQDNTASACSKSLDSEFCSSSAQPQVVTHRCTQTTQCASRTSTNSALAGAARGAGCGNHRAC